MIDAATNAGSMASVMQSSATQIAQTKLQTEANNQVKAAETKASYDRQPFNKMADLANQINNR